MNNRARLLLMLILFVVVGGTAQAAGEHLEHGQHNMHAVPAKISEEFVVQPSWPETIQASQTIALVVNVTDALGRAVEHFDVVHEKLMHLIVVSDDLQYFNHIHPECQGEGRFAVQTVLPSGGGYAFFCDYKPTDRAGQVAVFAKQVIGEQSPTLPKTTSTYQVQGETLISLATEPLKTGKETKLTFALQQAADALPVHDLQPYLGAMGHLVVIRETKNLSAADYVHAHAMPSERENAIPFMTFFPQSGWYKLFVQFNRGGSIVTAAFWVNVD